MEFNVKLSTYGNDIPTRFLTFNVDTDMDMDELAEFFDNFMKGELPRYAAGYTITALH